MNTRILGLLTACAFAAPMGARAQSTTLDYQGYVMGGTSTTSLYPGSVPPLNLLTQPVQSAPISTIATIDASFTYSGSLAQNNLVIESYEVNLIANNAQSFEFQNILQGYGTPQDSLLPSTYLNGASSCAQGGGFASCLTLTTLGDTVTGATISLNNYQPRTTGFELTIGPNGDAYSLFVFGGGSYGCLPPGVGDFTGNYVGPASASPCTVNVSNPTAGVWSVGPSRVAAPEIDPTSAASGLTLLLGGLMVLRDRRPVKRDSVAAR
jgi:hypothetical protein